VRANTNLGMLLLLAPLARAAGQQGATLRERLSQVLATLTLADGRAVYQAIRLVAPGGLGRVEAQDLRDEPTVTLREAMALAAERDSIAREYVSDYDVTFGVALPALRRARADGLDWAGATLEAYLTTLAALPDTLIARKQGLPAARAVSVRAQEVLAAGEAGSPRRAEAEEAFDSELRGPDNRLNPGTTADLVAGALFVALAEEH
jgi:triphosphoribosyl-dephospho-CoA synthase